MRDYPAFRRAIPHLGADSHVLLARSPLIPPPVARQRNPLDLHVLSTPPAFALSQNQTLRKRKVSIPLRLSPLATSTKKEETGEEPRKLKDFQRVFRTTQSCSGLHREASPRIGELPFLGIAFSHNRFSKSDSGQRARFTSPFLFGGMK
jgi:hypothetical protein